MSRGHVNRRAGLALSCDGTRAPACGIGGGVLKWLAASERKRGGIWHQYLGGSTSCSLGGDGATGMQASAGGLAFYTATLA